MFDEFKSAMDKKYQEAVPKYGEFERHTVAEINQHLMEEIEEWKRTNDFKKMVDIANCCAMIWMIIYDDKTREKNNPHLEIRLAGGENII